MPLANDTEMGCRCTLNIRDEIFESNTWFSAVSLMNKRSVHGLSYQSWRTFTIVAVTITPLLFNITVTSLPSFANDKHATLCLQKTDPCSSSRPATKKKKEEAVNLNYWNTAAWTENYYNLFLWSARESCRVRKPYLCTNDISMFRSWRSKD